MNGKLLSIAVSVMLLAAAGVSAEDVGIQAPEGFEVTLYAGDDLAHDIFSMTIDSQGRVVVAGRGYVKILHDTDHDGRADKATLFSKYPESGAHGMVFLGNDLIATGDNLLMRLEDKDGDGVADRRPIPLANVKSPEHGANGLTQGPDGWIYMACGNDAGVGAQLARTKTSPVKMPQAGAIVRFSPDFKTSEIFAHGFRNPYDLAFNENGHLFTVDADGERDQYLPWYTPTRLFDVQQGMHHGWVQHGWTRSWNRPAYFFDNVERLVEIGRGSPTGVECYRHYAFPAHYRGGIYSCCWTLGNVYYFPLEQDGATYKSKKEIFLQTTGEVGFAPVDLAVGPEGDMFVAIGGRGTRGSVFRVRYTGELKKDERAPKATDDLSKVLTAPQPLSAWSRAKWMPLAKKLDLDALEQIAFSGTRESTLKKELPLAQRLRAIEIAAELHGGFSADTTRKYSPDSEIVSHLLWAASRSSDPAKHVDAFDDATGSNSPMVLRRAWEALAVLDRKTLEEEKEWLFPVWAELDADGGRRIRITSMHAPVAFRTRDKSLQRMVSLYAELLRHEVDADTFNGALWLYRSAADIADVYNPFPIDDDRERSKAHIRRRTKRDAVRMMELCLGDIRVTPMEPDVYAGYTANAAEKVAKVDRLEAAKVLAADFPTDDADSNREIARLMGMLEVDGPAVASFAEKLTDCWSLKTSVQDDIHYLIVLSRLPGERTEEMTERTADALSFLHMKMLVGDMYPSRNWPLRVGESFVELCQRDPNLAHALAKHRDFGLPAHAMFARLIPEKERKIAARRLLTAAQRVGDAEHWTPEMIPLIAELDEADAAKAIREQWSDFALRDAIIAVVAKRPQPSDRKLFLAALSETNPQTVARAAEALAGLGAAGEPAEIAAALSSLRQYCCDKDARQTRTALGAALKVLTKQNFVFKDDGQHDALAAYKIAFDWFDKAHPAEAARLNKLAALDGIDWEKRLAKIDWKLGAPARGETLYSSRSCAKCHAGRNRLGPSLDGVTGRWSREDLFKEIVDPNRNVAPQFLTARLETKDGKVYHGTPIYQSPDGTLLQTGPDETIRIAGPEVVSLTQSRTSLMPTGLLRGMSDAEIADLYAYLKTLTVQP